MPRISRVVSGFYGKTNFRYVKRQLFEQSQKPRARAANTSVRKPRVRSAIWWFILRKTLTSNNRRNHVRATNTSSSHIHKSDHLFGKHCYHEIYLSRMNYQVIPSWGRAFLLVCLNIVLYLHLALRPSTFLSIKVFNLTVSQSMSAK